MNNRYRQQHCYPEWQHNVPDSGIFPLMGSESDRLFLTEWRRHKGLSQEALAAEIGYSRSTIAAAESRSYNATLAFLVAFATGVDAPNVPALFASPDQEDSDLRELCEHFARIDSEEDRQGLLTVARGLSAKHGDKPNDGHHNQN